MSKLKITPIGTFVYPKLITPDTKFNDDGEYSCKLHVSEKDFNKFSKTIENEVDAAYEAECVMKKKKLNRVTSNPIKITIDGDFEIHAKQKAKVRSKSGEVYDFSVSLYDSKGNPMSKDYKIGGGTKGKLGVEVFTWYQPGIGGFGYSLRLRSAQIIELVEYNGDAVGGFDAVEGGFVGESDTFNDENNTEETSTVVPF
jgi:hypothetical protein